MTKKLKPAQKPTEVEFEYIFSKDYNPVYSNGAYGGISPNKEIVVHFFMERVGIPFSQTHELKENGTLGPEVGRMPKKEHPHYIRSVENGIILSLGGAKKIHKWLEDRINELEKIEGQIAATDTKSK